MSELAVIDAETGELTSMPTNLFGASDPREVLRSAAWTADALKDVIAKKQLFKVIGKGDAAKAYVFVEAWQMLGSMLGVFPVAESVDPVEIDGVQGFKATVKAVTRNGEIVGRAVAYCMRDENVWSLTPKNSKGQLLPVRNLHALAAMAETRATSRALRKPLGFVMQLAGYEATAAEEMPTEAPPTRREVVKPEDNRKATKEQHAKLAVDIQKYEETRPLSNVQKEELGVNDWTELSRKVAQEMFGVESRAQLTVTQMHDLIEGMKNADVPF